MTLSAEDLAKIREIIREELAAKHSKGQMDEEAPAEPHLMTERDVLLICTSDDVAGAIDRWNKSIKPVRKGRNGGAK